MSNFLLLYIPLAAVLLAPSLNAQSAQSFSSMLPSLQSSATPSASVAGATSAREAFSPATATMVENRARTLGNAVSGSGTRYFAATSVDLKNLTPAQALARLTPPPISTGQGVRTMEISINLQQPLVVEAKAGQPVDIGTAVVQARGVQDIEVHASIFLNGVTVLNK